jgi:hypothetical protein
MVEALVGITIAVLLIATFMSLITHTIKINRVNMMGVKATMYLQELIEIAKDLEQSATTTMFAPGYTCDTCHPIVIAPGVWDLTNIPGGPEILEDTFYRSIDIGTTTDDNIKIATTTISWYDGFQNQTSTLETYLYYYD